MTEAALLGACLRAAPLCFVLPLPGLLARIALAIVLACAGAGAVSAAPLGGATLIAELARGLALGLAVAVPIYAARWAGHLIGAASARRGVASMELASGVLGWVIFCAAGGGLLLVEAYLGSYARWPLGAPLLTGGATVAAIAKAGGELLALTGSLALPALLALALVELSGALLSRFERSAGFPVGAGTLAAAARPLVAMLLLVASLAAFVEGVGSATRQARAAAAAKP